MNTDNSLPWRADHSRMGFGARIWDSEGSLACDVDNASLEPEENRARAEFIVLAANAHDDLVKAAEYALEYIEADRDFDEEPLEPSASMQDGVIQELRDAIANAQPKERSKS